VDLVLEAQILPVPRCAEGFGLVCDFAEVE
jgi:hypothetical protein